MAREVTVSVCDESCGDDDVCTDDLCPGGTCVHPQADDGEPCTSDHDDCTSDVCADGWCVHEPLPDGAPCAFDEGSCWTAACQGGACSWSPVGDGLPCTDGLTCTEADACTSGECRGVPPPACQDGAACSVDACADGPGFVAADVPFDDIAATGADLGLDGDDVAVGPFDLPFGLPLPGGAPRTRRWVGSNGLVSFAGPVTTPLNDCLPSTPAPNDLLAVLWDDLTCARAAGCGAWLEQQGEAPARRVIVQWRDLGVRRVAGSRVTMQAALHEDGRVDLVYARLDGADGASASTGLEGSFGNAGAAYSCGEQRLFAPTAVRFDPTVTWRCESWPEKGQCLVDGACLPEGSVNPLNPCEACQPWRDDHGYSPLEGERCDDLDPCTFGDTCSGGVCAGLPALCDDHGHCADRWCDGGGCNESWYDATCDDGDACTTADVCSNGRCVGVPEPDGVPCDDGQACTTADACAAGRCNGSAPSACDDGLGACRSCFQQVPPLESTSPLESPGHSGSMRYRLLASPGAGPLLRVLALRGSPSLGAAPAGGEPHGRHPLVRGGRANA